MKTLAELQAIREKMQSQVNMRAEDHDHIRVVVGMATCGIAAGARPVLNTLADEVQKRGLTNKISVTLTLIHPERQDAVHQLAVCLS